MDEIYVIENLIGVCVDLWLTACAYRKCEKRVGFPLRVIVAFLIYVVCVFIGIFLGEGIARMCFISVGMLLSGIVMFKTDKMAEYITQTVILFTSINIADLIVIVPIWWVQSSDEITFLDNIILWAFLMITGRFLALLFIVTIERFLDNGFNKQGVEKIGYNVTLFFVFYMYIISMANLIRSEKYTLHNFLKIMIISIILVIVLMCLILIINKINAEREIVRNELEIVKQKNSFQVDYYQKRINDQKEIKKFLHDLKNIEILLNMGAVAMSDKNSANKSIEKIKKYIETDKSLTENEILDMFLYEKKLECEKYDINFQCSGDFVRGNFIKDLDIGIIFGNMIDNAIEACRNMQAESEKYIKLCLATYEEFIVIKCINPYGNIKIKNGELISTKSDKMNHGLGLICLKETVEYYNGMFSYRHSDHLFEVTICIPIPERSEN